MENFMDDNKDGVKPGSLETTSNATVSDVSSTYHMGRIKKSYLTPEERAANRELQTQPPSRSK